MQKYQYHILSYREDDGTASLEKEMNELAKQGWRLSNSAPISWPAATNPNKRFDAIIYTFEREYIEKDIDQEELNEQRTVEGELIKIFLETYEGNRDAKFSAAFNKWYDEQKITHNVRSNVELLQVLKKQTQ